jgi:hypothetical protein
VKHQESAVDWRRVRIPGSPEMIGALRSEVKILARRLGRSVPPIVTGADPCATWHTSRSGLQEGHEPIDRVLIKDELIAQAVRPCLDLASGGLPQKVVKPSSGGHLIRMGAGHPRAWLCFSSDLGFERSDRPSAFGRSPCQQAPPKVVRFGQERLAVALRELAGVDEFECLVG